MILTLLILVTGCSINTGAAIAEAQVQSEQFIEGCTDAKKQAPRIKQCVDINNAFHSELNRIFDSSKVRYGALVCNDGWHSSCGCSGGSGCCSWHGGIGECQTWNEHEINGEAVSSMEAYTRARVLAENKYGSIESCNEEELPWNIADSEWEGLQQTFVWKTAQLKNFINGIGGGDADGDVFMIKIENVVPHARASLSPIHKSYFNDGAIDTREPDPISEDYVNGWKTCLLKK